MLQKEEKKTDFTGFAAHYDNGRVIYEKENFFSNKLNKKCLTSWAEIDKTKLVALELLWHGQFRVKLEKISRDPSLYTPIQPNEWYFSQTGYMDMKIRAIKVVSRNIGYVKDHTLYMTSVEEDTGIIRTAVRAV